jgi:Cu/Zn superoxide dismutase
MLRSLGLTLAAVAVLAVGGAGLADAAEPITVQLTPQNNSGESGTAVLTDAGPKTKVVVEVKGAPAGVGQPLHVHKGTCAQLDPKPAYGLTTLSGGKSETTIDVPIGDLRKGFAINGHKSAQEASTYVFCGNIPAQ